MQPLFAQQVERFNLLQLAGNVPMSHHNLSDFADCSEFRQTLAAQPPKIVHGTALMLSALLLCALGWAAWTRVNLVVLAKGRVRPREIPTHIYTPGGSEFVGRVVEAPFDEGDFVKEGDTLLRLDTSRLDNLISKLIRTIDGSELELINLGIQRELLQSQALSANQKSQRELQVAEESYSRAKLKRNSEVRDIEVELRAAQDHHRRMRQLQQSNAVSQQELVDAEAKLNSALEKLVQAQLPVNEAVVNVARQSIELVHRDFAVRKAELESRIVVKQGEKETIQRDLANLQLQRSDAVLVAPFDGIIVVGRVRVGDMLEAGKPVYEFAQQKSNCFEAVVSGEDVGQLSVGLPVRIRLDAYDYQKYGTLQGTVLFISPDSKPIEPGKPSDRSHATNSTAAFTVRVQLLAEEVGRQAVRGPVKLGLTGTAEIITDNESLLNVLLKRIRRTISLV